MSGKVTTGRDRGRFGVRDASDVASGAYPDMPMVSRGWTSTSAFFKGEGGILNIGLG